MRDAPTGSQAPTIRRATLDDAAALSRLGADCFVETWMQDHAMPYSVEDIAGFLVESYGLDATRRDLADPAQAVWLVERGGRLIGYALAGECTLPYAEVTPADGELKRIYLLRAERAGGTGAVLFQTTLDWLERDGPRRVWMGVWSGNLAAQRFYTRHGFEIVGRHTFAVGATIDEEVAMRRG